MILLLTQVPEFFAKGKARDYIQREVTAHVVEIQQRCHRRVRSRSGVPSLDHFYQCLHDGVDAGLEIGCLPTTVGGDGARFGRLMVLGIKTAEKIVVVRVEFARDVEWVPMPRAAGAINFSHNLWFVRNNLIGADADQRPASFMQLSVNPVLFP